MSSPHPLSAHRIIAESFSWNIISKARQLVKQSAVLNWGFDIGLTKVSGHVVDTDCSTLPLSTEMSIVRDETTGEIYFSGKCSCRTADDCAHAAALALVSANEWNIGRSLSADIDAAHYLGEDKDCQSDSNADVQSHLPPFASGWLQGLAVELRNESENPPKARALLYHFYTERLLPNQVFLETIEAHKLATGEWEQRKPYDLKKVAAGRATFVGKCDISIANAWMNLSSGLRSGVSPIWLPPTDHEMLDVLMKRIIGTNRAYFDNCFDEPLSLGATLPGRFEWQLRADSSQTLDIVLAEPDARTVVLPMASPWYINRKTKQAGKISLPFAGRVQDILRKAPVVSLDKAKEFEQALKAMNGEFPVPCTEILDCTNDADPIPVLSFRLEKFKNSIVHMIGKSAVTFDSADIAILSFDYGFDSDRLDPGWTSHRFFDGKKFITVRRQLQFEERAAQSLKHFGFQSCRYARVKSSESAWFPRNDIEQTWLSFMRDSLPLLVSSGWRECYGSSFGHKIHTAKDLLLADINSSSDFWFSLDLGVEVNGRRIALLPILIEAIKSTAASLADKNALAKESDHDSRHASKIALPVTLCDALNQQGKFYGQLPDNEGLFAISFSRIRPLLECLFEVLQTGTTRANGAMDISLAHISSLLSKESEDAGCLDWQSNEEIVQKCRAMQSFDFSQQVEAPSSFAVSLRPYQKTGLSWLKFIADFGLGGILADDMGLGKTVQTLAHILAEKQSGRAVMPYLIICPTSVMPNWQSEIRKLAPSLSVHVHAGAGRTVNASFFNSVDIVLTSFPIVARDVELLAKLHWQAVILDEAQAIKNASTKVAQAVLELKSSYRLCLTGTPLENRLLEFWSIFNFLMPGFLSTRKDFVRRFAQPIEKEGDVEKANLLLQHIKPFMLRRTKSEVAKDLPEKVEIIHSVQLEADQLDLYETIRLAMHEKVTAEMKKNGLASSKLIVLDALLKLRQACCDPALVKLDTAAKVTVSAKRAALLSIVRELVDEGRRVLIFSQFTSMLDLIAADLEKEKITFVDLRGETKDRALPVQRFQNGEVPVFLISLKAGGTGLNLTAADTVIHYDPWWNPAVENQATDRAHRIGQEKNVFVYKLIAAGTVEERMLELQERKRRLADSIVQRTSELDDLDVLSEADIARLFSPASSN